MTLEEFLLYPEICSHDERAYKGSFWIKWYNQAKTSFEKYGDNPPIGSKIETLKHGFGDDWKSAGHIGKLEGIYPGYDNGYFQVTFPYGVKTNLFRREDWWRHFRIIVD